MSASEPVLLRSSASVLPGSGRLRSAGAGLVAALLPLLAMKGVAAAAIPLPPMAERLPEGLSLPWKASNAEAAAPDRLGLLFPLEAEALRAPGEVWILVFDAALDVAAYQRRLRFCLAAERHGGSVGHSRCAEPIAATIAVTSAAAEDTVAITPTQEIPPHRPLAVWLDLINPITPGIYGVQLRLSPRSSDPAGARSIGHWRIRIEQPGSDAPDSGE